MAKAIEFNDSLFYCWGLCLAMKRGSGFLYKKKTYCPKCLSLMQRKKEEQIDLQGDKL